MPPAWPRVSRPSAAGPWSTQTRGAYQARAYDLVRSLWERNGPREPRCSRRAPRAGPERCREG
eukprot:8960273-Pyramimonas_sp.AAC.1